MDRGEARRRSGGRWLVGVAAVALALLQGFLLDEIRRDKADTIDEGTYLMLGARWWYEGTVPMNALPITTYGLAMGLTDTVGPPPPGEAPRDFTPWFMGPEGQERLPARLLAARLPTLLLTTAAGLALFGAGALLAGPMTGLITQALWVLSPNVLAQGSLATLDGWAAAWVAFVCLGLAAYVRRPSLARAAAVGVLLGLAGASKIPSLGFGAVAALVFWGVPTRLPWRDVARRLVVCGLAGALAVWAAYGFTFGMINAPTSTGTLVLGPVPAPNFFRNFIVQFDHGYVAGHVNQLRGEVASDGWWWYYLACVGAKGALGCFGLACVGLLLVRRARWRQDALLLLFPALLFVIFSAGKTQLGIRYLLPAFPPVFLWMALGWERLYTWRGLPAALVCLVPLGVLAAETARIHPDALMFFNAAVGGPAEGPRITVEGSDWCQDRRALGAWAAENGVDDLYVIGCFRMPMRAWAVPKHKGTVPCGPAPGIYAVHAFEWFRPDVRTQQCMSWLEGHSPVTTLGHTIDIYRITP